MKKTWPIYKTRLWLDRMNGELLTPKQYRIWLYIADRGPGGCDAWNWRIARDCTCSKTTVTRALKHLRKHSLILSSGDLGKFRILIACLHPNKRQWKQVACQNFMSLPSSKMTTIKDVSNKITNLVRLRTEYRMFHEPLPLTKRASKGVALTGASRPPGQKPPCHSALRIRPGQES